MHGARSIRDDLSGQRRWRAILPAPNYGLAPLRYWLGGFKPTDFGTRATRTLWKGFQPFSLPTASLAPSTESRYTRRNSTPLRVARCCRKSAALHRTNGQLQCMDATPPELSTPDLHRHQYDGGGRVLARYWTLRHAINQALAN